MKNLKIYKASAGSGKTFTLTVEYIRLVIENPDNYRHILAVTFTNKATNEMKERILFTLDKLARKDSKGKDYLKKIKEVLPPDLDDNDIACRARIALDNILHDYSSFRIETIDSFFQSIIRDLAHELSLTANLRVDLNQDEVLSDAVRDIIDNLQTSTDMLFKSVRDFIEYNISNNRNWKIDREVETFGKNIFNEVFLGKEQALSDVMKDDSFFNRYKDSLIQIKEVREKNIQAKVAEFLSLCDTLGCNSPEYFYKKSSGPYNYFRKLEKKDYSDPSDTVMKCIRGDLPFAKDGVVADHEEEFRRLYSDTVKTVDRDGRIINSVDLICQHINQMRLLNAVNSKVRQLNSEANRFLLADTAHFLHSIINESDIPFIYEKSGSRFLHIMIDEFQDTSTLQWENFKPLLRNSIDSGKRCLIVGDVKQSIYRWRNTDWEILNGIGADPGFMHDIDVTPLGTNHRSAEHIINFNNALFWNIHENLKTEYPEIGTAYDDVRQLVADKNLGNGYVRVEVLPSDDYRKQTFARLVEIIDELTDSGIRKEDITLLLRKNKEISDISTYFAQERPDLKIVSEEAYRLSSSAAINIIILALRYIANPNDRLSLVTLLYFLQTPATDIFTLPITELRSFLPSAFVSSLQELALTPLYELCHIIYRQLSLHRIPEQDAYLMSFYDNVNAYVTTENISISHFLTYWDEKLSSVNIPSGSIDGIRAMTIHKSKGLEFHTVICPFCSWKTAGHTDSLIWCEPTEEPFSQLPLTAISYKEQASKSIFSADYEKETMKNIVDNLNLLYVEFTRAEKNLIILTKETGKKKDIRNTTSDIAGILAENMPDLMSQNEKGCVSTYGTLMQSPQPLNQEPEPVVGKPSSLLVPFIEQQPVITFRQSNRSKQFIGTLEDDITESDHLRYINEGLIIHRFFELIHTSADTDSAINRLEEEGCFENESYKAEVLRLIRKALGNPVVADWFDPRWEEYNECTILTRDEHGKHVEKRPDRVITDGNETIVIDYKTGAASDEHLRQVQAYMQLLSDMGYPHVHGYLWYIRREEIKEIIETEQGPK